MSLPAHAPTGGPSGAAIRVQCPASVKLQALFPEDEDSEDAKAGVAAHWALAEQLEGRLVDVGQIAPNGVILTEEMVKGADMMFDDVTRVLARYGLTPRQGRIEQRVAIPRIHPLHFGTPDFYILIARPGQPHLLLLWDFKFGHRFVNVYDNLQLVEYTAGITDGLTNVDIVATIVQPRSYSPEGPVRRWETSLAKIQAHISLCATAAGEAMGDSPRARVGPECRDCRARHACPQLQRAGFAAMDEAGRVTPTDMTPEQIGLEARLLARSAKLMEARLSGLQAQLETLAKAGKPTPGWVAKPVQGRERWVVPAEVVIATGRMLHLDLAKPAEAITPAQAREKGLDPNIAAGLAQRGSTGVTLVEDDGSLARRVFG